MLKSNGIAFPERLNGFLMSNIYRKEKQYSRAFGQASNAWKIRQALYPVHPDLKASRLVAYRNSPQSRLEIRPAGHKRFRSILVRRKQFWIINAKRIFFMFLSRWKIILTERKTHSDDLVFEIQTIHFIGSLGKQVSDLLTDSFLFGLLPDKRRKSLQKEARELIRSPASRSVSVRLYAYWQASLA